MKFTIRVVLAMVAVVILTGPATAQTIKRDSLGFISMQGDALQFKPSEGVSQVVVAGDPSKPGIYVIRVRFAPYHTSEPHFHDQDRFVTVIKGTWYVALGPESDKYDTTTAHMTPMKAGSFVKHPANGHHFDGAKAEETIVQIVGMGPVKTVDVNPDGTPKKSSGR
jgi:quercetin dioxygenase-like cupin family protein